jgi:hypothetical protein
MTSRVPLPGWIALPFLLFASVCGSTPQRGREASLDLHGLGGGAVHVGGELPKVDAGRVLSREHVAKVTAAIAANLSTSERESLHEGGAR